MKKTICGALSLLLFGLAVLPLAACEDMTPDTPNTNEHTQHEYSTEWSKSATHHWHDPICDDTSEQKDKAEHSFNADHKCTVCDYVKENLGTLTVEDVTAWSDVEGEFQLVFKDSSKAEAVTYEYDETKITLDAVNCTVKAVSGYTGAAQVKVRSENHKTASFTVSCNELPSAGRKVHAAYAQMLKTGTLVDDNGNDTGSKITVSEDTTVFIGDSFFDRRWFWKDFYTDDYSGKDVFLAGISEATTNDWEDYMQDVFTVFGDKSPKNIVMHLGTNNLGIGQTAAETENGLRHFLTLLHKKFPQTKIYYFGITPRYDNGGPSSEAIGEVNQQTQEWCKGKDWVRYIDTPWRFTRDKIQSDGIHPLITSYSIFVEQLQKAGCVIAEKS